MIDELSRNKDDSIWNDWEEKFLYDIHCRDFITLTQRQKEMVDKLYDKLLGR